MYFRFRFGHEGQYVQGNGKDDRNTGLERTTVRYIPSSKQIRMWEGNNTKTQTPNPTDLENNATSDRLVFGQLGVQSNSRGLGFIISDFLFWDIQLQDNDVQLWDDHI